MDWGGRQGGAAARDNTSVREGRGAAVAISNPVGTTADWGGKTAPQGATQWQVCVGPWLSQSGHVCDTPWSCSMASWSPGVPSAIAIDWLWSAGMEPIVAIAGDEITSISHATNATARRPRARMDESENSFMGRQLTRPRLMFQTQNLARKRKASIP